MVWVGLEGVARGVEGAGVCGQGRGVGWRAWHGAWWGLEGVAQGEEGAGGRGWGGGGGWKAWHGVGSGWKA